MLRHTGALRIALHHSRSFASRGRLSFRGRTRSSSDLQPRALWAVWEHGCVSHNTTNTSRQRRHNATLHVHNTNPWCGIYVKDVWSAEYGIGSSIGSRRMIFSGGRFGADLRSGVGGGRRESIDEETTTSIRQGDDKTRESMRTVKLALAGNLLITVAKVLAYWHSGSSAMSSEAMHSLVDCANQALLLVGLRSASLAPDKLHQYGYGKSVYFWSLLSALGTFWLGAGITMRHSIEELLHPTVMLDKVGVEVWAVLGFSFLVDGFVLVRTLKNIAASRPEGVSILEHVKKVRDPTTLAVLLEDGGACIGVFIAIAGCGMSQLYGNPVYDSVAGVSIAALLGFMGMVLTENELVVDLMTDDLAFGRCVASIVKRGAYCKAVSVWAIYLHIQNMKPRQALVNRRFLIGQAVDPEITEGIKKILMSRGSIEQLHQVQSQWVGPHTFAFKAEVDFDGTYLAAKLRSRYAKEFNDLLQRPPTDESRDKDLEILLSFYTEDVMRAAEREVRAAEAKIRERYPEAAFIELEPDSSTHASYALEHYKTPALRQAEEMTIKQTLAAILKESRDRMETKVTRTKVGKLATKTPSSSSKTSSNNANGGSRSRLCRDKSGNDGRSEGVGLGDK